MARRHCADLRRAKDQSLRELHAAVCFQSYARGVTVRRHLRRLYRAASLIQATWRGCCTRRSARSLQQDSYNEMMRSQYAAALVLQRVYRGRDCRTRLHREQHASIVLQSLCRSWLQHLKLYSHVWKVSAVVIQKRWRGVQTRKLILSAMRIEIKKLEAVALLQALVLRKAARDEWVRMLAEDAALRAMEAQFDLEVAMATKLQKVWPQASCLLIQCVPRALTTVFAYRYGGEFRLGSSL